MTPLRTAFLLAVTLLAFPVHAQLVPRKTLTLEAARRIAAVGIVEAHADGAGGAIAVVDEGGALVYFERLDGTFPAAAPVSFDKAHTAATFLHATKDFEDAVKAGRVALTGVKEMTPLQGGVPLVVGGQTIGAVGVSGAASAARDEVIARAAAGAAPQVDTAPASSSKTVLVFPAGKVREGFAKGSVLANAGSYQVHTSRRDSPGKAEIHTLDTDVFTILDGSATLVTGGKVPDAALVEPWELRGSRIDQGETRALSKGDVVVVPAGTPHWFREVHGPLLYLAVKVRNGGEP